MEENKVEITEEIAECKAFEMPEDEAEI